MGGITVGSEVLIKRNDKWYKVDAWHYESGNVDLFFKDNPNPLPSDLPWYIEFISEKQDG